MGGEVRFVWTPAILVLSLGAILGFFQNCTPAVPFGNVDFFSSLVSSPDFPYEAGLDQLAYMSCSEQADVGNDGTFFTFKAGAYDSLGLRIHQTYRDNVVKVDDQNVVFALQESTFSAGTRLQLAVRTLDNLQLMYVDQENGVSGLDGFDFKNFFPPMGNQLLSETLWYMEPDDHLRSFAGGLSLVDTRFEGRLQFMKSQLMENDLRSFLSNRGVITLTFATEGEITPIGPGSYNDLVIVGDGSAPAPIGGGGVGAAGTSSGGSLGGSGQANTATTGGGVGSVGGGSGAVSVASTNLSQNLAQNVFGMGVQPRFKQPLTTLGGNPGPDMPPRVLSRVQDIVIDERLKGQIPRPWSCPDSMQFMIVLPGDATYTDENENEITRCAMLPDPPVLSAEMRRIRQSLLAEDWFIDPVRRCAVPKADHVEQGSCYGRNSQTQRTHLINYDTYPTNGCGFGNANGLCPHYASICFRQ